MNRAVAMLLVTFLRLGGGRLLDAFYGDWAELSRRPLRSAMRKIRQVQSKNPGRRVSLARHAAEGGKKLANTAAARAVAEGP